MTVYSYYKLPLPLFFLKGESMELACPISANGSRIAVLLVRIQHNLRPI